MALILNNHVFKGHRTLLGSRFVTYGEVELPLRYELFQKSDNNFDWGNTNKSSLQLAFSMLCQIGERELALKYADKFAKDIISNLISRDWVVPASDVHEWINNNCETTEMIITHKQTNHVKTFKSKVKTNVIKEICKELNITQKNLALILEVPEGTVSSWAVKNEIPRLGKKAIEFYIENVKNQKIVDSYRSFKELLEAS